MKQGHALVSWPSEVGATVILRDQLTVFSKAADLVVVDGPFPLERTKRSWRPAAASLFFDELRRKHKVTALGPTPTVDLLTADPRYFQKWCKRLDIPYASRNDADAQPWASGGWFRPGEMPATPIEPLLLKWAPLFRSIGFNGWFELTGTARDGAPTVTGCAASWPSVAVPDGHEAEFLTSMAAA